MNFKDIFKELRNEKNVGQQQLAQHLGVSKAVISFWETGRNEPTAQMLIKIADFFDVTTDFLLGREDYFGNVTVSSGNVSGNGNTVNSHNTINARMSTLPSTADAELLHKYHAAPEKIQKAIKELLS